MLQKVYFDSVIQIEKFLQNIWHEIQVNNILFTHTFKTIQTAQRIIMVADLKSNSEQEIHTKFELRNHYILKLSN